MRSWLIRLNHPDATFHISEHDFISGIDVMKHAHKIATERGFLHDLRKDC